VAQKSLLGLSVLFHGALGVLVYRIDMGHSHAATAIQVADAKKHEAPKPPPEAAKPPPPAPKHVAKRALAPAPEKPAETPPPVAAPLAALPDFGVELSGGVGGLAVAPAAAESSLGSNRVAARSLAPAVKHAPVHALSPADTCDEPASKPKPRSVPQPAYTERAREAGVEGKVRVELTVDEAGRVVAVRVIQGLGYGLDEAAVAAAQSATFEPAVRCGKPARATFTISMRFSAA
jgi:periplasmic protein TonB